MALYAPQLQGGRAIQRAESKGLVDAAQASWSWQLHGDEEPPKVCAAGLFDDDSAALAGNGVRPEGKRLAGSEEIGQPCMTDPARCAPCTSTPETSLASGLAHPAPGSRFLPPARRQPPPRQSATYAVTQPFIPS
jgi:hypothetical protein